jgi:hypothetical protein
MRITRATVRIAVPPLLALGLVAALSRPADAAPTPAPQQTTVAQLVDR